MIVWSPSDRLISCQDLAGFLFEMIWDFFWYNDANQLSIQLLGRDPEMGTEGANLLPYGTEQLAKLSGKWTLQNRTSGESPDTEGA